MARFQLEESSAQETPFGTVKRVATTAALKPFELAENLIAPLEYLGIKNPRPYSGTAERLGLSQEYLKPQSGTEDFIYRIAQGGPLAAAIGGIPALASLGIGAGAAQAAGALGAPEWLKDLTQLGTEIGSGVLGARNVKNIAKIPGIGPKIAESIERQVPFVTPRQAEAKAYKAAGKYGKEAGKFPDTSGSIGKAITSVEELLESETQRGVSKKIGHALEKVKDAYSEGRANPGKLFNIRTTLNELSKDLTPAQSARYVDPLKQGLKGFFMENADKFPQFYESLNKGDQLKAFNNMQTYVNGFAKGIADIIPGSIPGLKGTPLAHHISNAVNVATREGERYFRGLANPAARSSYYDMIKSVASNNPGSFIVNAANFASYISPKQFGEFRLEEAPESRFVLD